MAQISLLSPGVQVREFNLAAVIPSVSTTVGAFAGLFSWGPCLERTLVSSELDLTNRFGKPTVNNQETWLVASSFLAYSSNLQLVRAYTGSSATGKVFMYGKAGHTRVDIGANVFLTQLGPYNLDFLSYSSAPGYIPPGVSFNSANASVVILTENTSWKLDNPLNSYAKTFNPSTHVTNTSIINALAIGFSPAITNAYMVQYDVSAGNTVVPGLAGNTRYFVTWFPNGTHFTLSNTYAGPATVFTTGTVSESGHTLTLVNPIVGWFVNSQSMFSAMGIEPGEGPPDNFAAHTIINDADFPNKAINFEPSVTLVAKYPGNLGNALRVSVCASPNGFHSVLPLPQNGVQFSVNVGSNTATINVASVGIVNGYQLTLTANMIDTNNSTIYSVGHQFNNEDIVYYYTAQTNTIANTQTDLQSYGSAYIRVIDDPLDPNHPYLKLATAPNVNGASLANIIYLNNTGIVPTHVLLRRDVNITSNTDVTVTLGVSIGGSAGIISSVDALVTPVNHGFNDGDKVTFFQNTASWLSSGLGNNGVYYVVNSTTDSLSFSTRLNGIKVALVGNASGTGSATVQRQNHNLAAGIVATNAINQVTNSFNVYDILQVGNTSIGTYPLKVASVTTPYTNSIQQFESICSAATPNTFIFDTAPNFQGQLFSTGNLLVGSYIIDSSNHAICNVSGPTYITRIINSTAFTVSRNIVIGNGLTTISVNSVFSAQSSAVIGLFDTYYGPKNFMTTNVIDKYWEFYKIIGSQNFLTLSDYVQKFGNAQVHTDQIHVVVVDKNGAITGTKDTILESYKNLSRANDCINFDGTLTYWKDVLNRKSQWVRVGINDPIGMPSSNAQVLVNANLDTVTYYLILGRDGKPESNVDITYLQQGFDLFKNPEEVDVSLLITGKTRDATLPNYLIQNIAEERKDCVVFVSPPKETVVDNLYNEVDDITSFRNELAPSSYAFLDSGYKYTYNRPRDTYTWVPLCADMAGLCVRTDADRDAWWSPAGYNRGIVKNVVKLAFNPDRPQRDLLYTAGINPVITSTGSGTILFGDKTLLNVSSAFDRINVRRLFIILEKAIAKIAKFSLFEFNDEFTRLQFRNIIVPYLRNIQARRGLTDFLVQCDSNNNPPEIIDSNGFVASIFVKPNRSINYIQLNFIASKTDVQFSEISSITAQDTSGTASGDGTFSISFA